MSELKKDYVILTQSSLSTGTELLGFLKVMVGEVSHLRTDRDRERGKNINGHPPIGARMAV